ncbi:MAG: penicillin acylase family protein [Deltaproteobacteria bacterium]|nr:penicillin acylase family protein [Deltaproteobacteria bacterium]
MRSWKHGVMALALATGTAQTLVACGDGDEKTDTADSAPDTVDASDTVDARDTADDASDAADTNEPDVAELPDHFPDKSKADETLTFPALSQPVRVVYDNRGIPHIYGAKTEDVAFVQGFVTARDRIFQMHTLRSASKGRLAEYAGAGSLSGDVFLRLLKLGKTAEAMAAYTAANDAALQSTLEAFTAGVNAYLGRLREGKEVKPPEVQVFGTDLIYDWTPADTMAIVRLQTWDLGFGGIVDELTLWDTIGDLRGKFEGTALEGIELDVANFEPTAETATLEPEGGAKQKGDFDLGAVLAKPFFTGANPAAMRAWAHEIRRGFEDMEKIPHRAFRGNDPDAIPGSNNWVVAGTHTESGRPIVANDTHLALRNPAVFYQVHVSTKLAGGNLNSEGVNFAGAPGITLGHNDHAAWGGTVFYSDVTDMYVEKLDATKSKVWYEGAWVDLVKRPEVFSFPKPDNVTKCIDAAPAYVKALEYTESLVGTRCTLNVTVLDVPHHGPIIPWSIKVDGDNVMAVSWRWTGFDATDELGAVFRLNTVASFEDFKAALDRFGVGAQNWIYGGTDGDIGWYPSHKIPVRKHIAAGNYDYPPFLPMPGDTAATQWDGWVPRAQIPQSHNPAKGFLVTANADPVGVSFDNDPFNDGGPYIGYVWDPGYRVAQITKRIQALIDAGHKLTIADMKAIQADHRSNLGADLAPSIVAAIDLANSSDTRAAVYLNPEVLAAAQLLEDWAGAGYEAASGVGAQAGSAEAKASAATAIFNAFLPYFLTNLAGDEGGLGVDKLGNSMVGRFLRRLFLAPETMVTFDSVAGKSPIWDDVTTTDVVETKAEIITKSLRQAVDFLKDPAKVGPSQNGGFGTTDMGEWRWGNLHTVKMKHNVAAPFDIPSPSVFPNGFPRAGDNFTVDACNPGFYDTFFGFTSGAAIRNVYELKDTVVFHGVIPGGQQENPNAPHYQDEAALWSKNEAPEVAYTVEQVLAAKERTVDFVK